VTEFPVAGHAEAACAVGPVATLTATPEPRTSASMPASAQCLPGRDLGKSGRRITMTPAPHSRSHAVPDARAVAGQAEWLVVQALVDVPFDEPE
jgi:hypothetical protein